jgi:hypothetical protein
MKTSCFVIGGIGAIVVMTVILLITGVRFERPLTAQGSALYDPAGETIVTGVVQDFKTFACPVSEGEDGGHLFVKTENSVVRVHLAPGRILRGQNIFFTAGDHVTVTGAKFRFEGGGDLIAREIARGNSNYVFRDRSGKLMLVQ